MSWLETLACVASVASAGCSSASSPTTAPTANRCRTCFLKLDDEGAQWKDLFVCHLPPSWDAAFVGRMFNHLLSLAYPEGAQRVDNVFLLPKTKPSEMHHGFVNLSSHEAACFLANELGKSLFSTCGAYVGAQLDKENMRLYLNLVMERSEVVEQYVLLRRAQHLERLAQEQRHVIHTLVHDAAVAQNHITKLEHMLMQLQGRAQTRLLPKM